MSNIQKFKDEYSSNNDLENELFKIEEMDISNIKKIDLRQQVIEKYHKDPEWLKLKNWHDKSANSFDDEEAFRRSNEIGRWGS